MDKCIMARLIHHWMFIRSIFWMVRSVRRPWARVNLSASKVTPIIGQNRVYPTAGFFDLEITPLPRQLIVTENWIGAEIDVEVLRPTD